MDRRRRSVSQEDARTLPDGRSRAGVRARRPRRPTRRFLLTNPDGYSLTYNGLVMAVEKRRARTAGRRSAPTRCRGRPGCRPPAGRPPRARRSAPWRSRTCPFGRDPNDLTNARGRLPNDRPHMFRAMGSVDVPRTGFVVAANLQYFSGKPWAATAQVDAAAERQQRVLLEPRGSRRLSSQSLLDRAACRGRSPLAAWDASSCWWTCSMSLNDTAEEGLATDVSSPKLFSTNTSVKPTSFMDPRRAMVGVRLNLGIRPRLTAKAGNSFRQIDQDDIRVLPRAVEHDGFPVRCDVERP